MMIYKRYTFMIMILIILYILYLISFLKYNDYEKNSYIESIKSSIVDIEKDIEKIDSLIEYKKSNAYINKVLKQEQNYKNKWEKVIYITSKEEYDKYTIKNVEIKKDEVVEEKENKIKSMTIHQKWIYFIFKKDIR